MELDAGPYSGWARPRLPDTLDGLEDGIRRHPRVAAAGMPQHTITAMAQIAACILVHGHPDSFELLPLWFHLPVRGSFVEIGANDGLSGSQTLVLERCLGWDGLLIEANPTTFATLLSSATRPS